MNNTCASTSRGVRPMRYLAFSPECRARSVRLKCSCRSEALPARKVRAALSCSNSALGSGSPLVYTA